MRLSSRLRFVLLATLSLAGEASSQSAHERLEQQKMALLGFYVYFNYPLQVCALAGPDSLARARTLIDAVRMRYTRTFEAVERHPVYMATVAAARAMNDLPKDREAAGRDCVDRIKLLETPQFQRRYDRYMDSMLEIVSPDSDADVPHS